MKVDLNKSQHDRIKQMIGAVDGEEYGVFYDGAFDVGRYSKSKIRILWVLKEAVGDYGVDEYNIDLIDSNTEKRTFCKTLEIVAYTSYGILNDKRVWNAIPSLYEGPAEALREIAIINVSKAMGATTSPNQRILRAYENNKLIIEEQLKYYDPDVIIFGFPNACSGIVYDIIENDGGNTKNRREIGDCAFFTSENRKYIWHYHPARRHLGDQIYVEEILEAAFSD